MPKGNSIIPNAHFHKKLLGKYGPYPPKARHNQAMRKAARRAARAEKAAAVAPRPLKTLRPSVRCATIKYNTRARLGRGFTLEELRDAKVDAKTALTIGISVDNRRRNKSVESKEVNVARLKAYVSKLVVFPRKKGAKKAGDADAAALGNVQQQDTKSVVPLAADSGAVETKAITAAMQKFNAYSELRNTRTNLRYAGIRAKRIKDKEEEDALLKKK